MAFSEHNASGVIYMQSDALSAKHAFTTRYGGVSRGIYASLNLGVHRGDEEACVAENYYILCSRLGLPRDRLVFSHQVHECHVRVCTAADGHTLFAPIPYDADGLVTNEKNLVLAVFTADCIPVLLHDPVSECIGAVHAGWRGTVGDIVGEGVRTMVRKYGANPTDIHAAIGEGIGFCCFETGPEVPQAVRELLGMKAETYIRPGKNEEKFYVDLKGINAHLLQRAGVLPENIDCNPECTMCLHDKYWSHRYTKGNRGVMAALIML